MGTHKPLMRPWAKWTFNRGSQPERSDPRIPRSGNLYEAEANTFFAASSYRLLSKIISHTTALALPLLPIMQ